jgi:hypothetical protein
MRKLIAKTFIRTFSNGDFDTEFDKALTFHRGLIEILPSMPTQAPYNKPDNWQERNRIGLERVKEQLQTCINSALVHHLQRFNLLLTHNGDGDNEEQPIVWHESILDEYWNRLEEEINQNKHLGIVTEIEHIGITNVEIKKERLDALVAILRSRRATNSSDTVDLDNVNLCEEGIISLSKLVDASSMLNRLFLDHNRIDNMDLARCLSRSLKLHDCLNTLCLLHCDLGSSPEILSVLLQSDVKHIILENNNIDSFGAITIAEYLESDPPIEELCLAYNRLNDDDVILISRALKRNTNLHEIDLVSNKITSIGVRAVLTCVFDSSSLNAISESNHTLGGMDMFLKGNNETHNRLQDCISRLLGLDRMQKILHALQDKDLY